MPRPGLTTCGANPVEGAAGRGGLWPAGACRLARALVEVVFPRRCVACRHYWGGPPADAPAADAGTAGGHARQLSAVFHRAAGRFVCPDCLDSFEPAGSPLCSCCGLMFPSRSGEDHLCGECIQAPPAFRRARAAGIYSGALMALIHHVKYRAGLALIDPLALLLLEAFRRHWHPGDIDVVLPIPLHAGRLRRRGFNQAQLLTDAWAAFERGAGRCAPRFPKARRVFIRARATTPQTGLGKPERRRNIRGAFSVVDPRCVAGRRILLVDDVYTTGATADEAARALTRSGAADVDILTLARTMPRF